MNGRQSRLLIAALSSGVLGWFALRRTTFARQLPAVVGERIVIPLGDFMRETTGGREENGVTDTTRMMRKVGRNRKISVGGKLYGPLGPELVGQSVEIEERDGRLVVFSEGDEVGSFEQQG
jgi:hypothetical protein